MPYILNRTNGSVLATVGDGSINQTTDLTFVGKNYAGYGEYVNEDLLRLLENFSNKTAPPKAITGQLWYDSATKKIKVYDGSNFLSIAYTSFSSNGNSPTNLTTGDFWFDKSQNVLNVYTGSRWLPVGPTPTASTIGGTAVVLSSVKDTVDNDHIIAKHIVSDSVVAVTSWEDPINLATDESIYGSDKFTTLRKGINLAGANPTTGQSATSLALGDGYYFWGTSANALTWGADEYTPDDFLKKSDYEAGIASGLAITNDYGVTVGDGTGSVFKFWGNSGNDQGLITLINGNQISFELQYNGASTNVLNLLGNQILPGYSTPINIGRNDNRFAAIFANTFTGSVINGTTINATSGAFTTVSATFSGNITGNVTGNVTGNITGNSIGLHTGNVIAQSISTGAPETVGNFTGQWAINPGSLLSLRSTSITTGADTTAGTIQGRWTLVGSSTLQATYADLAERYAADATYDFGTVLVIGGDKEVTVTTERASVAVAGIVSQNPAYMLNCDAGNDETHPYIALKGRVLCKVTGSVKKGNMLVTSNMAGVACAWQQGDDPNAVIGKALESSEGPAKLILVKV